MAEKGEFHLPRIQRGAQQPFHLADDLAYVQRHEAVGLAGVGQQTLDDAHDPVDLGVGQAHALPHRGRQSRFLGHHLQVGGQGREGRSDFMRERGGELADDRQALRLHQAPLGFHQHQVQVFQLAVAGGERFRGALDLLPHVRVKLADFVEHAVQVLGQLAEFARQPFLGPDRRFALLELIHDPHEVADRIGHRGLKQQGDGHDQQEDRRGQRIDPQPGMDVDQVGHRPQRPDDRDEPGLAVHQPQRMDGHDAPLLLRIVLVDHIRVGFAGVQGGQFELFEHALVAHGVGGQQLEPVGVLGVDVHPRDVGDELADLVQGGPKRGIDVFRVGVPQIGRQQAGGHDGLRPDFLLQRLDRTDQGEMVADSEHDRGDHDGEKNDPDLQGHFEIAGIEFHAWGLHAAAAAGFARPGRWGSIITVSPPRTERTSGKTVTLLHV